MPKYTVRVADDDNYEDYEIEANTPAEACQIADTRADDANWCFSHWFEESEGWGKRVDSVWLTGDPNEVPLDVPLYLQSEGAQQDAEIATLEEEIKRLKLKCGELTEESNNG